MKFHYQPRVTDVNQCWKVSKFRYEVNKGLGWASQSKDSTIINDILINGFIGALGELAVSKIFGIEWDGAMLAKTDYLEWRKIKADLGPFEVKTVSTAGGKLMLHTNDKDFAVAILVYAPDARESAINIINKKPPAVQAIQIIGCISVSEAKKIGKWQPSVYKPDQKVCVVDRSSLKPRESLEKLYNHFNEKRKVNPVYKCGTVPPFRLTQ